MAKILTQDLLDKFLAQGDTSAKSASEIKVIAKFFTPDAQCSWFITDFLQEEDLFFGYCSLGDPDCAELGYVSKTELETIRGHLGLPVERDTSWDSSITLKQVMDKRGIL